MHDATGYHPAIYMILQNTSSADLSFKPIKFQCLFRDLKNGYVTVAREEIRREFKPNQQLILLLEGPHAFELPIDKTAWPLIECKVMCRAGNVDDDDLTQDVLITKLDQEAMTDEEVRDHLLDYSRPHMISRQPKAAPVRERPTTPLVATALPLNGSGKHGGKTHETLNQYLGKEHQAGLGDDFYELEQLFGKPSQANYYPDIKWTWAQYAHEDPAFLLFAGSRGHGSKVDYLVAILSPLEVQQDSQLIGLARTLSGKLRSQPLSTPVKTVKYLNTGRIQLASASAPSYKVFFISPRSNAPEENNYIVGLTRVAGEPRAVLGETPNAFR